jgi:hypothetical protein
LPNLQNLSAKELLQLGEGELTANHSAKVLSFFANKGGQARAPGLRPLIEQLARNASQLSTGKAASTPFMACKRLRFGTQEQEAFLMSLQKPQPASATLGK